MQSKRYCDIKTVASTEKLGPCLFYKYTDDVILMLLPVGPQIIESFPLLRRDREMKAFLTKFCSENILKAEK